MANHMNRAARRAQLPQNIGRKAVANGRKGIAQVAAASRVER